MGRAQGDIADMHARNRLLISFIAGGFLIACDQLLKYLARTNPDFHAYLWDSFLGWELYQNPGIAFSIPFPNRLIVLATPIVLCLLTFWMIGKWRSGNRVLIGGMLVLAGAVSNYADRVLFGVTTDYLRILTSVVNLADLSIAAGALALLFPSKKETIL